VIVKVCGAKLVGLKMSGVSLTLMLNYSW
jgi:hypothetical protein